jgi:hypothetical protein
MLTNLEMKLKLYYSPNNKVFKLVNVDAVDSEKSYERNLDAWSNVNAKDVNITYWKNMQVNRENPFRFNRVRIHYTVNGTRYRKHYFCIDEIIRLDHLQLTDKL